MISPNETHGEAYCQAFDARDADDRNLFGWLYQRRLDAIERVMVARVSRGARVLDVGCAQGNLAIRLAKKGYYVTAVEINPQFVKFAKEKDQAGSVKWIVGDIALVPSAEPFDCAVLGEVIEHTSKPDRMLAEVAGLLRQDGIVIITTPNADRFNQPLPTFTAWSTGAKSGASDYLGPAGEHHRFLFTRREILRLLAPSFSDVSVRPLGSLALNHRTEPLLKSRLGRRFLRAVETILLAPPICPWTASGWLAVAIRRVARQEAFHPSS